MIVAGCDVGSLTSKAVIMKDSKILASNVVMSGTRPEKSALEVMEMALSNTGLSMGEVNYCVGTGYGRNRITFINETASEIACHARGARWLLPSVKTIVDIGGQDCKVIKVDSGGRVVKFTANDKCASGTGRFLEVMARVLGIALDDLGVLSLKAKAPVLMASACTVWAQADVIQHINDGIPLEDIAAGINSAMAARVAVLVNNIGLERDVCMTGGVAKNRGVVSALEKLLGVKIRIINKVDPQIVGALGAALAAREKIRGVGG
ncbi:MAG: acyl-CoA dehydratase activase [Bacillota bacterium]